MRWLIALLLGVLWAFFPRRRRGMNTRPVDPPVNTTPQPCVITDLQDLVRCLHAQVTGTGPSQTLTLDAVLLPAAAQLLDALKLDGPLTITGENVLQPQAASVDVVGEAKIFAPQGTSPALTYPVTLVGTVANPGPDAVVALVLTTTGLPEGWSFGANFTFPDYQGYDPEKKEPAWLPSFFGSTVFDGAVFTVTAPGTGATPTVGFSATLDATQGALAPLGGDFPEASAIPVTGTIDVAAPPAPLIALASNAMQLGIPGISGATLQLGTEAASGSDPAASTIGLSATLTVGSLTPFAVTTPLLQGGDAWTFTATPVTPVPLPYGLAALPAFLGLSALPLPDLTSGPTGPALAAASLTVETQSAPPAASGAGVSVVWTPTSPWTLPMPGLAIQGVHANWNVADAKPPKVSGGFGGQIAFGTGEGAPYLDLEVDLGGDTNKLAGTLVVPDPAAQPASIGAIVNWFTGFSAALGIDVTSLDFTADSGARTYAFTAMLDTSQSPFSSPVFTVQTLGTTLAYTPTSLAVQLVSTVAVVGGSGLVLQLTAEWGSGDGWVFAGGLAPSAPVVSVGKLLDSLLPGGWPSLPSAVDAIQLTQLDATYATPGGDYTFAAAVDWNLSTFNAALPQIGAGFSLAYAADAQAYSGGVTGSLEVDAFTIGVGYSFDVQQASTLTFNLDFNGTTLTCTLQEVEGDTVLTANLSGVTLGDVLGWLASYASPGTDVSWPAPWSAVSDLSLDGLTLTVDVQKETVGFTYVVSHGDFGFIDIESVSLTYVSQSGEPTVMAAFTGSFFGTTYGAANPLTWDAIHDAPPAAGGSSTIAVKYLGMGQNVGFQSAAGFNSVLDVIAALEAGFPPPVPGAAANPLTNSQTLRFTGDERWLIGVDFTIMEAIRVVVVFNDPVLYGLHLNLSGDRVKQLSGLDFDVLYKKVTDSIGVYQMALTLPDKMRQMKFGAVNVTVPTIDLSIYTNGNFYIDAGFPNGLDFSNSFALQMGDFVGYGGFYFGYLNGQTSSSVPKITNGTFAPVIEFGLALAAGLGVSVDKGILSASAAVTIDAIVQGALGWFNPYDASQPSDLFYHIQGTAALVGHISGEVNFYVVKAEVSVTATASVTLTVESYQAIQVDLHASVEVEASITIAFIKLHFSFSTDVDLPFTLGSASTPPWIVAATPSSSAPLPMLRQQRALYRPRRVSAAALHRWLAGAGTQFDWTPRNVFGGATVPVPLVLTSAFTVADEKVQAVLALFVPNGIDAAAHTAREVRRLSVAAANAAAAAPFTSLATGMLAWAVGAVSESSSPLGPAGATPSVTAGALAALQEYLGVAANRERTFTYGRVAALMGDNFHFTVVSPINGATAPPGPGATAGTVFPMVPELTMSPAGLPAVDFATYKPVPPGYEAFVDGYYDALRISPAGGPTGAPDSTQVNAAGATSLAQMVFADYFGLLTKGAVGAARSFLEKYPHPPALDDSLASLTTEYGGDTLTFSSRTGDTLATIAARFAVSTERVRARNPGLAAHADHAPLPAGTAVALDAGPTPATIAHANAGAPLWTGRAFPIPIQGVVEQLHSGESLGQVASRFGFAGASALFSPIPCGPSATPPDPNANNRGLLRVGATITIPESSHQLTQGDVDYPDPLGLIAARYYVWQGSFGDAAQAGGWASFASWYASAIAGMNPSIAGQISVPVAALKDGAPVQSGVTPYVVGPNDTLYLIAQYFALIQLGYDDPGYTALRAGVKMPPPPLQAGSWAGIPQLQRVVVAGDTLCSLAQRFSLLVHDLAVANETNAGLLQPLAGFALPPIQCIPGEHETLGSLAARYDLTLDQLADGIAGVTGLFVPADQGGAKLTIPDVPARDFAGLVADMEGDGRFRELSAMVSRFLLHGMRVPDPAAPLSGPTADVPLYALPEMVGQQFPAPSLTAQYPVGFANSGGAGWIDFGPSGLSGPIGPGMTVVFGGEFLANNYPGATLAPNLLLGPTALPLYDTIPQRYSLQQSYHWQASETIALPPGASALPPPLAGQPSILMFPPALLATIAQTASGPTGPTPPYRLDAAGTLAAVETATQPLNAYSWATAVQLRVRLVPAPDGSNLANAYQLVGADQAGRDLLLAAWSRMEAMPPAADRVYLLYTPNPAGGNPNGLASDVLSQTSTFVLKTNLSTVTHSGDAPRLRAVRGRAVQPQEPYAARIDTAADFLKYVWEASVTGSGGFYLNYSAGSGEGLPSQVFGSGTDATVWLLLLLEEQSQATSPDRRLYSFNNCAVSAENLDASAMAVFAELADPTPADLHRVLRAPAGAVGFRIGRKDPGAVAYDPATQTEILYSHVGYRVEAGPDFARSPEGLPVGPAHVTGVTGTSFTGAAWLYEKLVPVSRFGNVVDPPATTMLPPADATPYRGITGPVGADARPRARASLSFRYHDVFGNTTTPETPLADLSLPVGYTDPLVGVGAWPGAGFDYLFAPGDDGGVALDCRLSLQSAGFVGGGATPVTTAVAAAKAAAQRYATVYYQVQQHDVDFALGANLGTPAVPAGDLKAAMLGFVTRAKLFTDTAAALQPVTVTTAPTDTLASLAAAWNVTPAMLAEANGSVFAGKLFAGPVPRPHVAGAPPSNTLASLIVGHSEMPLPPACATGMAATHGSLRLGAPIERDVSDAAASAFPPLTIVDVATQNAGLALTPGITLRTEPRRGTVAFTSPAQNTIAAVAASVASNPYATVADPAGGAPIPVGLVPANLGTANLLAPGVTITIGAVSASTTDHPTLGALAAVFAAASPPIDLAAFVKGSARVQGIFRQGAPFTLSDFIVPPPATVDGASVPTTLATLPAAFGSIGQLAALNAVVPNFFAVGAPVYTDYECYAPQPSDTLAAVADGGRISLSQLGTFAGTAPLAGGVVLEVPALATLPPGPCYAAALPLAGDTLAALAARFGSDAQTVAALNESLPGFFGVASLNVGGTVVPVTPLDSLASVWGRSGAASFDQFVADIAAAPGIMRANGAVVVPLPVAPPSPTLNGVAATLNVVDATGAVDAALLLDTNRTLAGFLNPAATVTATPTGATSPLTVPVGPNGTVDSVIRAFARQSNAVVTTAQIAAESGGTPGLLAAGARFLLPPAPTRVTYPVAPVVPPPGASGQALAIFPIDVELGVHRAAGLVAPDFAAEPAVYQTTSRVGPRLMITTADGTTGLAGFAESFEDAFAPYRLKCALSTRPAVEGAAQNPALYAVNFGPKGISGFAVTPEPQFFAMPPLSTELVGGTAMVQPYISGCGLCTPVMKTFDGIDLDQWMQQLLDTVDLALSAPYAVPAFAAPTGSFVPGPGCSGCGEPTPPDSPVDYAAIVDAKRRIATALGGRAAQILALPGVTGQAPAIEALRQEMYEQLASAYAVDAIVGMPAGVAAPFGGMANAPRLSGKIVPAFERVAAGATSIDGVATAYGVSSAFLAATLATVAGVLDPAATVTWGQKSATVGAGGTIASVAAQLGATPPVDAASWGPWSAFVEGAPGAPGIGAAPIFRAGVELPLTRVQRAVGDADTLTRFAEFLGTDPLSVGEAAQDVAGLLESGQTLTFGTFTYPVQPGDTLAGIVAAIDAQPHPPAPVVDLGDVVAAASGVRLAQPRTLSFVTLFPDVTLSPAKVPLTDASWLTFLLGIRNEEAFQRVFLNLRYAINELEYDIASVTGVSGYQASSWLSFLLPIGDPRGVDVGAATSIPQIQVPLPLRVYPTPPTLVAQGARASVPGPTSIADAKLWDYHFDFASSEAAQDRLFVEAELTGPTAGGMMKMRAMAPPPPAQARVFGALAEFVGALPELKGDLAILPTLAPGTSTPAAAVAVQTLGILAGNVASALEPSFADALFADGQSSTIYDWSMEILSSHGDATFLRLGFSGEGEPVWPGILVQAAGGPTGGPNAGFEGLTMAVAPTGATASYRYPADVPSGSMTHRFVLPKRDVAQDTFAWGGVWLTRNTELVAAGPLGLTGSGEPVATNEAFVYRTPVVRFINPAMPLLSASDEIDISTLPPAPGSTGSSIAARLENLLYAAAALNPFAGGSEVWLEITCRYGYEAAFIADRPLYAWMPVMLVPATVVGASQGYCAGLEGSLKAWQASTGVSQSAGAFGFDLTLLTRTPSTPPSGRTARADAADPLPALAPVLRLENLVLPFPAIDWST